MKTKLLFLLALLGIPFFSPAQWYWSVNFDDGQYLERFTFDTATNPNCVWEIGTPAKPVFSFAHSGNRAMVTDSVNPVPPNDTSSFLFFHILDSIAPFHYFTVSYFHQMHGDSSDFGIMEMSPDGGMNWVNAMTEDSAYGIQWAFNGKPQLRGSTNGWEQVMMDLSVWTSNWGFFQHPVYDDTLWFRFTYITDSASAPMDGWIIDDFELIDYWEGISDGMDNTLFDLYPNPTSGPVQIRLRKSIFNGKLTVTDLAGRTVYLDDAFAGGEIDTEDWPRGMYFVRFEAEGRWAAKRFVIR